MADTDDVEASLLENAAAGIQSATNDGHSVTAMDPLKQFELLQKLKNQNAANTPRRGLVINKLRPPGSI